MQSVSCCTRKSYDASALKSETLSHQPEPNPKMHFVCSTKENLNSGTLYLSRMTTKTRHTADRLWQENEDTCWSTESLNLVGIRVPRSDLLKLV